MSQSEVIMLLLWSVWLVPLASGSSMYNPRTATPMRSSLACENSLMGLDCERKSGIIRIIRANYGRFSLTTCNSIGATSEWNVSCRLPESKRIVAERCDGHPKCEIMASDEVFGDPCVGTFKYLKVYYTCEPIVYTLPPLTTTEIPTTTTEVTTTTTKATTTNLPQRQVCDAIYFEGRNWPYTKVGEVASMSCSPPRVGRITWRCTGNGWKGERPDNTNCQIPVTVGSLGVAIGESGRFLPQGQCQTTSILAPFVLHFVHNLDL